MELRFWIDPETGLPHIYETQKAAMKKQRLPRGWSEKKIRELAAYHDRQTEKQQAADIEAALAKEGQTVMVVPTGLVPEIHKLISQRRTA